MNKIIRMYRKNKFHIWKNVYLFLLKNYQNSPFTYLGVMRIYFFPEELYLLTGNYKKALLLQKEFDKKYEEFDTFVKSIDRLIDMQKAFKAKEALLESDSYFIDRVLNEKITARISYLSSGKFYQAASEGD